jgi:hypothetical protein
MAGNSALAYLEGSSTNRPPLFDGNNFNARKDRFKIYVCSIDYSLWHIFEEGPYVPMKMVDDVQIPKLDNEFNEEESKKMTLNYRAMNIVSCALNPDEYNRVRGSKSAHKMWKTLEVTHEGTNQVKESKLNILVREYELFSMKPNETINEMNTRFTNFVNGLRSYGKEYSMGEMNRKILNSLPKSWEGKALVIEEAKNLKTYPTEELIGSLLTYELTHGFRE